jgi:hypothetical protein
MRWIWLLFFLSLFPLSKTEGQPRYDERQMMEFKGKIVSVQRYSYVNRPIPYVQFLLRTQAGDLTVQAGPEWYLDAQGINIVPGVEMEVRGSLATFGEHHILIARSLKSNDLSLPLLSPDT